jgi:hypothetical protein
MTTAASDSARRSGNSGVFEGKITHGAHAARAFEMRSN